MVSTSFMTHKQTYENLAFGVVCTATYHVRTDKDSLSVLKYDVE